MARTYSRDEVQAILARAVEQSHGAGDSLSHQDLLAIGREMGISSDAIEAAADSAGEEVQVQREVEARATRALRRFARHFVTYVMVVLLCATINMMTGGPLWFVWMALGWGIGIAVHAVGALSPDRERIEQKVRKRLAVEREREERRKRRSDVSASAKRVVGAAQRAAVEVLDAMADTLESDREKVRVEGRTRVAEREEEQEEQVESSGEQRKTR